MYAETNGKIGALELVHTETSGAYGGIGETSLHSRLSLLSIDMDCNRIGKQFLCVLYSVILQRKIHSTKTFEKKFCGLALSTKYF